MSDPSNRNKRIFRSVAVLGFLLIFLVALEVFSRFFLEGPAATGPRQEVQVTVPAGASMEEVASLLYSARLIEHPRLFLYAVRMLGADTRIQAGTIRVAGGQSLFELIGNLTRAKAVGRSVTIREGLTSMQIAGLLRDMAGIDSIAFMEATRDSALMREFGVMAPSLEGYLFPDTYSINVETEPKVIVRRMVSNFNVHLPKDVRERAAAHNLTLHEIVALASIIEWEVLYYSEAKTVSSVYHNRLKRGMLLQADPTVAYALGKGPSRLLYRDLKVVSPYNTYLNKGLPPGAINNPGLRAIEAALSPLKSNYIFFVAQGNGKHAFTNTLSEHLIAKQRLDEVRREARRQKKQEAQG